MSIYTGGCFWFQSQYYTSSKKDAPDLRSSTWIHSKSKCLTVSLNCNFSFCSLSQVSSHTTLKHRLMSSSLSHSNLKPLCHSGLHSGVALGIEAGWLVRDEQGPKAISKLVTWLFACFISWTWGILHYTISKLSLQLENLYVDNKTFQMGGYRNWWGSSGCYLTDQALFI